MNIPPSHTGNTIQGVQHAEEQAQLATAVENAAEAIIITDIKGHVQYVNPAFESISGYTPPEIISRHVSVLDSGKQNSLFFSDMWQTIKQGDVWKGHFINKKKDGSLFETEATISPVRNSGGEIINFVSVQRDVTHEI